MTVDLDNWHSGSSWPYLYIKSQGQDHRWWSQDESYSFFVLKWSLRPQLRAF